MAHHGSFLTRLARDKRGNTIAIMAAAMVPLIGFSGSAIDMARLYVVKVRLQQACDAGALAGRKAMTDTTVGTPLDAAALTQARAFFRNNFNEGWYKTSNVVFTPTKSAVGGSPTVANTITATASTTVPMSVMGFFGIPARQIAVDCQARFDLADADVMFVLDTTGSMSCYPTDPTSCATASAATSGGAWINPEKGETTYDGKPMFSKIESLRQAVILFDSTMRANADSTTTFRYGFVPYSSSVNVGYLLPSQYRQTNWTYQSRRLSPVIGTGGVLAGDYAYGAQTDVTFTGIPQNLCGAQRYPATGFSMTGPTGASWGTSYYQAVNYTNVSWTSANSGTCTAKQQPLRAFWRYEPIALDTTQYLSGNLAPVPGRLDGMAAKWDGCIEELNTSAASSFSVESLPDDLNPDVIPTNSANLWRPLWPEAEWYRPTYGATDIKDESVDENRTVTQNAPFYWHDYSGRPGMGMDRGGSIACGKKAQTLQKMTAQEVRNYVYDPEFQPHGGTYHDVGMIWGTRLLSTKGVFASTNKAAPGRNDPSRTIVFITDGIMSPSQTSYGLYGLELWENRVGSNGAVDEQKRRHNARFLVQCAAAKQRGITVYTVAVGLNGASAPELDKCSSNGKAYAADDTETLKDVFETIAQRVAMLRLTQ